jgi:hypothetical protein
MEAVSKITAIDGNAITALQKAEHAAGPTPFSSPAQPSHLPDIGKSFDMGMLAAAVTADLKPISGPVKPCMTSPTAKTKATSTAEIRRIFANGIRPQ